MNVHTKQSRSVEKLRRSPIDSSINAMLGWSIESELVTAERKSRKKNKNPKSCPNGRDAKKSGKTLKPKSKRLNPAPTSPETPKNATAAGTVIRPPRHTSQNSFAALDESALKTISSFFFSFIMRQK